MRLPVRVPTTTQIRKLESDWISTCDKSWGQVLMEVAGLGAAHLIFALWQKGKGVIHILCGRGNNGGDGLVVARYLTFWGVPVEVWLVGQKSYGPFVMSSSESANNLRILEKLGITPKTPGADLDTVLLSGTMIVDALLGTGIDRSVEGDYRNVIDSINRSGKMVVAVDLPSGINSDTGQALPVAVQANHTVTFGCLKPGLLNHPGAHLAGHLRIIDIGLPELANEKPRIYLTTADFVRKHLPIRPSDSHKGTFGRVLTIAGSFNMPGATILASESALRVGAGLSVLAAPRSIIPHLPAKEIIYRPLEETSKISISLRAIKDVEPELEAATSIIVGPGLSQVPDTVLFVQELLKHINKPCVVDADALNAIAENIKSMPADSRHIILTPHPKELSRLTGVSVAEIQSDRVRHAREASTRFNCIIVLKGARTVIADPEDNVYINPTGNPGMATAGSGDVLSGAIGSLLAQGLKPLEASVCGVYIHGMAGDVAASKIGVSGIVAGDISEALPFAISSLIEGGSSQFELELIKRN